VAYAKIAHLLKQNKYTDNPIHLIHVSVFEGLISCCKKNHRSGGYFAWHRITLAALWQMLWLDAVTPFCRAVSPGCIKQGSNHVNNVLA
jgi:hypothetical protein